MRLLVIEDREEDHRLLVDELERGGYRVDSRMVNTEPGLVAALAEDWDLVISDYAPRELAAETALAVVRGRAPELPFIIASGSVGEEKAVEALKAGASDFVLKDRLARLVPAIQRELREARTRLERTKLREQLLLADRLASIGTLAAGVAHEINNPLAVALGNVEYALSCLAGLDGGLVTTDVLETEIREPLADARDALGRVRDIVRDVKLFSRAGDPARRGRVELRAVLKSALRMTWNEVRHRARLVEELGDIPAVDGNDSRLGQVFLNLLVNAIQALPDGRATDHQITVRTRTDAGGWAVVEIADTGCGIAAEHLGHVFEPFFTTKPVEVGAGVGLAISHTIVTEHGGSITVDSELGVGTSVRVALPPSPQPVPGTMPIRAVTAPEKRGRILLVDDEPMLGPVIKRALAAEHDVTITMSSREALAALAAGPYDVILCDLMMPDIDGLALFGMLDAATQRKVVFMTAGAFSREARSFLDGVLNRRLDKPFDPEQLRTLMRDLVRAST